MAEGALAALFIAGALGRLLAPEALPGDEHARLQLGLGAAVFQSETISPEILGLVDIGQPRLFQPVAALSFGPEVGPWLGLGARWTFGSERLWAEASFLPGLYETGDDGPNLGLGLEFRTSLGVSYAFENGVAVTLAIDHRSNGSLSDLNPGLETLGLRVSIPIGQRPGD